MRATSTDLPTRGLNPYKSGICPGGSDGMIQEILSQEAVDFMRNPYLFDDLARSVRQALDK